MFDSVKKYKDKKKLLPSPDVSTTAKNWKVISFLYTFKPKLQSFCLRAVLQLYEINCILIHLKGSEGWGIFFSVTFFFFFKLFLKP